MPSPAMDVRMIVGGEGTVNAVVGVLLHPTRELIVGTVPGTPAAKLAPVHLSELLGLPWASHREIVALQVLIDAKAASLPDGRTRTQGLR